MVERDGMLFINPGSAGPSVQPADLGGGVLIDGGRVTPRLVTLAVPPLPRRR